MDRSAYWFGADAMRSMNWILALCLAIAGTAATGAARAQAPVAVAAQGVGDEFLVVDCLLPGRMQRIGRNMTYVGRRPAERIAARTCEIRGGEYVAHDRANYDTSLRVWLPLAEGGDARAQTYVGDIFAKGLGRAPDYVRASQWYEKAVAQNFRPAMFTLATLYDTGSGVARDPARASALYRRAAGLEGMSQVVFAPPQAAAQPTVSRSEDTAEIARLRAEVRRLQIALDDSSRTQSASAAALRQERAQIEAQRADIARQLGEVQAQRASASAAAPALALREAELARRETALDARDAQLGAKERELAGRQQQARLESELVARREALAAQAPPAIVAPSAPPQIVLIDPEIQGTRSEAVLFAAADSTAQAFSGRVTGGRRLVSLSINGQAATPSQAGVFGAQVPVSAEPTPVRIVAVDEAGQRGELRFEVRRALRAAPAVRRPQDRERDVVVSTKLGRFRAILFANANYRDPQWRDLASPYKDVDAIAAILRERYGFEVEIVRDATRETIGSTFFRLAQTVGEDESVLVYYAGHGAFLPTASGNRGYWIPVDGDKTNPTNWISADAINDWVGMFAARKVMVVSDSCFSGLLLRSGSAFLQAAQSEDARLELLRNEAEAKSRVYLTSGRDAPVLDEGGGQGHSVFARSFLDVLRDNSSVLTGRTVFARVEQAVLYLSRVATRRELTQQPDYRPMETAGHVGGDFIFVPRA
jgi:hypothetical protein